jgi:hypothetical protein
LGHPTELSKEEEAIIVERLVILGEWDFPLNDRDLSHLVKSYLDGLEKNTRQGSNQVYIEKAYPLLIFFKGGDHTVLRKNVELEP